MTNKKNLITLLAIAFVVAIIATGLFYGLVVSKFDRRASAQPESIVVAARDLKPGAVLRAADLKLGPRSSADPLAEVFDSPEELDGLVVLAPVRAGQALERSFLVSGKSSRGAAAGIPPGLRAVSVHVTDSTGVVELLRPGFRVDVQLVTGIGTQGVKTLRTVLQDLAVLRVEPKPEPSEDRPVLPVVTLLATPEAADVLGIADAAARLRLVARHPLDDRITKRGTVTLRAVLKNPPKQGGRGGSAPAETSSGAGGQKVEAARKR